MPGPTLQDLPSAQAHLCLNVRRFALDELNAGLQGAHAIVALSGGSDSVALLRILHLLSPSLKLRLTAVHLDHGLRPTSAADADFCRQTCDGLDIPIVLDRADVAALADEWSTGLEDAGRRARYELLERARQERNARWIATGHTLDDLAEDQLMRQIRGAGWPGLGGMDAKDDRRRLLRPLLMTPKAELRQLLTALGQPWREDETNQSPDYTRNRVRAAILPRLLDENPNYLQAVTRQWRLAALDRAHLADTAELLQDTPEGILLPRQILLNLPPSLRLKLYKTALERLGPGQPLFENLMNLERAFAAKRTGTVVQFPGGKTAGISRAGVVFRLPE